MTSLSNSSQFISELPFLGAFNFSLSYKLNTEACTLAFTAPFVIDESLFPSILTGRPSRVFTKRLAKSKPSKTVVA